MFTFVNVIKFNIQIFGKICEEGEGEDFRRINSLKLDDVRGG